MKIRSAEFLISAPDAESCPESAMPEFAFIGRSNVGKSSLINMLTGKAGLAKVSSTPGKTILINFYTINNEWRLVDLPGYGYAKLSKAARIRFQGLIRDYLGGRPNLAGTFVLIDSMLPPQKVDLEFLEWMVGSGLPFILVFTKTDRISKTAARANVEAFLGAMKEISEDQPSTIVTSSKTGDGKKEILALIAGALNPGDAA